MTEILANSGNITEEELFKQLKISTKTNKEFIDKANKDRFWNCLGLKYIL